MDNTTLKQQALTFIKGRNNLLAVIILTVVNIILTAFDAGLNFLFSATIPQFVYEIGKSFDLELGTNIFMKIGLVMAFIIIVTYFVFWLLSKRIRGFILAALIFFSIDSVVLLSLILIVDFEVSYLLEIAFHGWILFYLINGTRAWYKLRGINTNDFNVILQEIKTNQTGIKELSTPDKID